MNVCVIDLDTTTRPARFRCINAAQVRGCKPWDGLEQYCIDYAADTKETCGANDWCPDEWCYVDPNRCDKPTYQSSYFAGVDLHFSYSKCDRDFVGNSWVGQAAEGASTCPGVSGPCACIGNQGVANGSSYGADIGNSCDAWDGKEQYCIDYAADSKLDGGANDWCTAKFGPT